MKIFIQNKKIVDIQDAQDIFVGENGTILTIYADNSLSTTPYLRGRQSTGRTFEVVASLNPITEIDSNYALQFDYVLSASAGVLIAPGKTEIEIWYEVGNLKQCIGKVQTNAHSTTYDNGEAIENNVLITILREYKDMKIDYNQAVKMIRDYDRDSAVYSLPAYTLQPFAGLSMLACVQYCLRSLDESYRNNVLLGHKYIYTCTDTKKTALIFTWVADYGQVRTFNVYRSYDSATYRVSYTSSDLEIIEFTKISLNAGENVSELVNDSNYTSKTYVDGELAKKHPLINKQHKLAFELVDTDYQFVEFYTDDGEEDSKLRSVQLDEDSITVETKGNNVSTFTAESPDYSSSSYVEISPEGIEISVAKGGNTKSIIFSSDKFRIDGSDVATENKLIDRIVITESVNDGNVDFTLKDKEGNVVATGSLEHKYFLEQFRIFKEEMNAIAGGNFTQIYETIDALDARFTQFMDGSSADNIINTLSEIVDELDNKLDKTTFEAYKTSAKSYADRTAQANASTYAMEAEGNAKSYALDKVAELREELSKVNTTTSETIATKTFSEDGVVDIVGLGGTSKISENLWDEQWRLGAINSSGTMVQSTNQIASKNYIKVEPNTTYYVVNNDNTYPLYLFAYSSNTGFIGAIGGVLNSAFTTPNDCYLLRFYVNGHTTYNNDIAIIKGTSGSYTPYYDGIRYTTPSVVEKIGKNIIDFTETVVNIGDFSGQVIYDSSVISSGTLGILVNGSFNLTSSALIEVHNQDDVVRYYTFPQFGINTSGVVNGFYSINFNNSIKKIIWRNLSQFTGDISLFLSKGSTLEYTPYQKETISYTQAISEVASALADKGMSNTDNWLAYGIDADNAKCNLLIPSQNKAIIKYWVDNGGSTENPSGTLIYELETPITIDVNSINESHLAINSGDTLIVGDGINPALIQYELASSLKRQVELNWEHDKEQQKQIDMLEQRIAQLEVLLMSRQTDYYDNNTDYESADNNNEEENENE